MNGRTVAMVSLAALVSAATPAGAAFQFSPAYGGSAGTGPAPVVAPVESVIAQAEVLQGFGSDLAVETAIRQIVPPDVEVSWGAGVDRNAKVSWQGGKPWPQVLADALAPAGLEVGVGYGIVEIRRTAMAMAPMAPMAPPPMAAPAAPAFTPAGGAVEINSPDAPGVLPPSNAPLFGQVPANGGQVPLFAPMEADASAPDAAPAPMAAPAVSEFEVDMPAPAAAPATQVFDVDMVAAPVMAATPADMADIDMVPAVTAPSEQVWNAESGKTLRAVLQNWATEAGWAIAWESDLDYPLMASAAFVGSFEDASRALINAFAMADPPVMATLYRGNNVIVVSTGAP